MSSERKPANQPADQIRRLLLALGVGVTLIIVFIVVSRQTSTPREEANMAGMSMGSDTSPMDMTSEQGQASIDSEDSTGDMPDMTMEENSGMDMRPVETGSAASMPADARGNQAILPTILPDGTKEFDLTASVILWNILPNVQIGAYAYNQQVSGPEIRVALDDRLRIRFRNDLPEPTSVHWHGLILPNKMDGASDITQAAVEPGETFIYEFDVAQTGTYFYHTHKSADRQQALGLYGSLIVEPTNPAPLDRVSLDYTVMLGEWAIDSNGNTLAAMNQPGMLPNYFTINGKSYPDTETLQLNVGERIRLRFVGSGQFIHPMHVHGGPFEIVETDGNPVPAGARLLKDTVLVGPGERYDVIWEATEPGRWLIHCHINDHVTNNGVEEEGGGGLMMIIEVSA